MPSVKTDTPVCAHQRMHFGLDRCHCPDCRKEFLPKSKEYKEALDTPTPKSPLKIVQGDGLEPSFLHPPERFSNRIAASGWIEKYLVRGRWEHYRYCWQPKYKGKVYRTHIPKDCGKLNAVQDAIALHKSPTEIEQLIKSWRSPRR